MTLAEPTFPPLLSGRLVVKGDDPCALAIAGAVSGELGAGDTLWLQDPSAVAMSIIVEPDHALTRSAQLLPLAMAAFGDSLASLLPPQVGVQFRWPGTLLLNGATVGTCSLTIPHHCAADHVPEWMVVHFALRFSHDAAAEPGSTPSVTSLSEEGGEELSTVDVIESVSRHFLSLLDTWQNDGFSEVASNWSGRIEGRDAPVAMSVAERKVSQTIVGRALGLDEDGNLLVKPEGGSTTLSLSLLDNLQSAPSPSPAVP